MFYTSPECEEIELHLEGVIAASGDGEGFDWE